MKNLISLFLIILLSFLLASTSFADEKLVIADFDSGQKPNNLGGTFIHFETYTYPKKCVVSFNSEVKHGYKGFSSELTYDVSEAGKGYFGMTLNESDFSKYNKLVLWVKGSEKKGFTNIFKVELINARGESGEYYIKDITNKWKKVVIPFKKFTGITDFSSMSKFYIWFEHKTVTEKEGAIYIDNIYVKK